jgi:hypothetical protein
MSSYCLSQSVGSTDNQESKQMAKWYEPGFISSPDLQRLLRWKVFFAGTPRTVWTTVPFFRKRNVGMADTEYFITKVRS